MNLLKKIMATSTELSKITDSGWRRKRIHHRINGPIQYALHGPGMDYANADWDTLIILDACRADLFEETVDTEQWDSYKKN
jgi:hypothetical protein